MALPPPTNEAFLREVDDELRRDELLSAWRRYGRAGIAAVVAALLLFGAWLYWQHRSEQQAGLEGEQLQSAYEQIAAGSTAEADTTLSALAASKRDGYRALAEFAQADQLLAKNDAKGAAARLAAIAADASLGQPFRDLALLRQTVLEYDGLPPQTVVERLRPLASPGSAWFGTAGELTAVAYVRQNRRDLAGRLFGQIARDEGVPDTLRQRAVQMASLMGVDAAQAGPNPAGVSPRP